MDTIAINSVDSETSHSYRLLMNLLGETSIKISDKYVGLSNLNMYYAWEKIWKVIQKQ